MKKLLILLLLSFFLCSSIYAADDWWVFVADDDIDTTAELITELDTTYLQLTTSYDTLEVVSDSANDTTQVVTVYGIDNNGYKCSASFELNGDAAVCGPQYFQFVDYAVVDGECAGTITIRRATNDVFIVSIPAGHIKSYVAQHFSGENNTYITSWSCGVSSTDGNVLFELRWYPDDTDSRCFLNGYEILDRMYIDGSATSPYGSSRTFDPPIRKPAGGWIAVFGTGSANNCDGHVMLQGYDYRR